MQCIVVVLEIVFGRHHEFIVNPNDTLCVAEMIPIIGCGVSGVTIPDVAVVIPTLGDCIAQHPVHVHWPSG